MHWESPLTVNGEINSLNFFHQFIAHYKTIICSNPLPQPYPSGNSIYQSTVKTIFLYQCFSPNSITWFQVHSQQVKSITLPRLPNTPLPFVCTQLPVTIHRMELPSHPPFCIIHMNKYHFLTHAHRPYCL